MNYFVPVPYVMILMESVQLQDEEWDDYGEDAADIAKLLGLKDTNFVDAEEFFDMNEDSIKDIEDPEAKNDPIYHLEVKVMNWITCVGWLVLM